MGGSLGDDPEAESIEDEGLPGPHCRWRMAQDAFSTNLMRAVVAELHALNLQTASRDMFGKSYFSLGIGDKMALDQVVLAAVGGNYAAVTPEWLAGQAPQQQPVGFGIRGAVVRHDLFFSRVAR